MPVSEERSTESEDAEWATEDCPRYVLTAEDAELFSAALNTPSDATPRALKTAGAYRRRVLHAD